MAVVQAPFLVAVLLLVSPGLHCSSPPAACPESCTCQRAALLNCSSSGLSSVPQHIQDSVTGLDLSQNRLDTVTLHRPYRNLRNVWLENNTITHLSLCIDTNLGAQSVRGRHSGGLGLSSRRRCVSWAPALQLLSVERNQLMQLPEGLERSASLWVLQLSFNKISTLRPGELRHLRQLKELHLKHNLITNLHPQMFQDLAQLRVLDLSFNMLTNLHPSMYLSLHNIGSDVRLDGNRWQCDCSMRSLRRRMAYDSNRGLQTWGVVCAFPSVHSGKDLLQLEEDDLNCFGTENSRELHRDVTVYSGSEILLSCSKQDSSWLKPSGQESVSGPQASLLIGDVTDKDTGLYVCMTEDHEVVSVFNLQISRVEHALRKTRSLPRNSRPVIPQIPTNRIGQERNQRATQSDLALAVCLSVFITFLIAFILGVLARPFIDVLCKKVTNKRSRSATNSVSSAEQRQYENEAYSESEEPEEIVTHRERRVTFRTVNIGEDINVEYYDTVASGNKQSVEAAKNEKDEHTAGDSGSENGSRQVNPENNQRDARDISCTTNTRRKHNVQLDNIPDSEKLEERSLSSCSDSSLSDRELKKDRMIKRDHTSPKSLQRAEDSVQQGADSSTSEILEVEELSIDRTREMSEFSSEPFADWSPHADDTRPSDSGLWQENEEQFEFSDSAGSNSERSSSLFGSFNDSRRKVLPTSDIQSRDDVSSCSSSLSADEPTQYTVNPDQEEEDAENNPYKSDFTNTKQDASFQQQISGVDTRRPPAGFNQGNYPHDTLRPAERPEQTSSSQSSDSEPRIVAGEKDTREKIKPKPRPRWRGVSLGVREMHMTSVQFQETQTPSRDSDAHWPALDLENTIRIKRRLDIKAPSPSPDSSSSSDSEDETTGQKEKKRPQKFDHSGLLLKKSQTINLDPDARWPALDLEDIPRIKRRLDVKAPSPPPDSSSSSVSDNETTGHREKKRPQKVHHSGLLLKKSQTANHGPDAKWPAVDLENIPTIKRRLDIDGDTKYHTDSPGKVDIVNLPLRKSQTLGHNIHTGWPALDLENIPTIKRRLDVKTPSPPPDSSSSGESDGERTGHTEKKRSLKVHHSGLLLKESQTANRDLDARWPALDLENIPTIKRRLDIKAPSTRPDSSSSSDSDDEATHAAERPGKVGNAALPLQKIPTTTHDSAARWPALDLEHIPTIKRRLDVKAPSPPPDSSSSSDSKDETTHLTKRPGKVDISQIKKQDSGSSSSSENDDETTGHIEKKRSLKVHHSGLLLKESQTANRDLDVKWPALDLENIPTIKRRLDIKAPSTSPDSSSSSDSDDETIHAAERPGKVGNAAPPLQKIPTATYDPAARWPALDLEYIPTIKRRLDVKAPSPPPDSSSRSDSKDGTTHLTKRPGKVDISLIKKQDSGSSSKSYDPLGSAVNLDHVTRIKRRLDIKAPSSPPKSLSVESKGEGKIKEANKIGPNYSSSSSVEQDKYTEDISNPSMTIKPDPRWPELRPHSAPRIKRHLDIKTHSPSTESSSSSDKSDNESTYLPVKVEGDRTVVGITNYQPGSQFPDSSFSSNANGTLSNHTLKHETDKDCDKITTQEQQKVMHNINLGIPKTRRRLDIKAPSPQPDLVLDSTYADVGRSESNSSTSESEDENSGNKFKWSPKSPLINIPPKPKTDHTIKLEKYTVITDDLRDQPTNDNISPTPEINPELQSRWNNMNLGVSRFRKRLDITSRTNVPPNLPTTPLPDSPSSYMGESGTGNQTSRTRLKKNLVKVTEEKSNQDILLTGFGTPRVRGYLDTKVPEKAPGTSPLHQQSDSVSSSESEGISTEYADYTWRGTSQLRVVPDVAAPTNHTSLLVTHAADESHSGTQVERKAGVELKGQASEEGDGSASMWPHLSLTNIPKVKRALDIRAPLQRESFPGCNSEDETDHTVPELKPGVARINRRLNIKAPSPEPNTSSSSSSESDNEVTGYSAKQSIRSSNMSAMTDVDYSQIAYKRSIIKAPRQRDSFSSSGRSNTSDHPVAQAGLSYRVGDRSASLSPWGVSSIEEQSSLDVSPEIRWTGIGRNLPDFSSLSTRLDLGVPPPQRAPPAEPDLTPPDSSNSSDKIKHDRVKAYESLMHRFSYPTASRGSVASSRSLDKLDNTSRSKNEIFRALSEDRKEKKGLGALKAISSKRLQWDTDDKDKDAV